ncbi:CotH kinase family protein [Oribacterium sp. P9]|uniref:CotH kinase family protein n=1 Tax=Oribacterium sp. P9 TaxID=3378068 RepID=UPI003967AACD
MKGRFRKISFCLAVGLLLGGIVLGAYKDEGYHFPEVKPSSCEETTDLSEKSIVADETFVRKKHGRTNFREKRIWIDESFVSNLPLVVIHTNEGERPPAHIVWNTEEKLYLPNENEDIYLDGELFIYNSTNGANRLSDAPSVESAIRLRRRGNSSVDYDKAQYLIKLVGEDGKANRQNLLQMGTDNEWVLNVSFIDKSLLRNYLAYATAREIMPYVPDCQYCEVIWYDGQNYQYEGVYLLMENIKVGKERVDLPRFVENSEHLPFLLRRDRWEPDRLLLNNYARRENLLEGVLRVEWPSANKLSEQSIQRITNQIDEFEKALFAEDYETFLQYRDMIDIDSFVDYLILNEFLINYDAGFHSTYMYSSYNGKLTMGPVWDFDGAMDNYYRATAELDTVAFFQSPWFKQILRDPEFTERVVERYEELRKTILSDESIGTFLDETVAYLGPAIERDWARWGYFYKDGDYLTSDSSEQTDRNTKSHAEEVERIKKVLSEHGKWLDKHMDTLYQFVDPNADAYQEVEADQKDYGSALAVVFVAVFLISVKLVLKYESE